MLYIVANEKAGHGKGKTVCQRVKAYLEEQKSPFCVMVSQFAGHAVELARRAVEQGAQMVLALGGDGTIREVAQGMIGSQASLGVIPAGTGNDIITALKLPKDPIEALKRALCGKERLIDVGMMGEMPFLNVAGTGFDIETLQWTLKFKKHMRGILPYLLGVICSIVTHRDIEVNLRIDGKESRLSALLIAVANGQCFGGGMRVAPRAVMDDGMFDVLVITGCPRWKIPFLLPAFILGNVDHISYAKTVRAKEVMICRKGQIVDVDGELIEEDEACFRLEHKKLRVLV